MLLIPAEYRDIPVKVVYHPPSEDSGVLVPDIAEAIVVDEHGENLVHLHSLDRNPVPLFEISAQAVADNWPEAIILRSVNLVVAQISVALRDRIGAILECPQREQPNQVLLLVQGAVECKPVPVEEVAPLSGFKVGLKVGLAIYHAQVPEGIPGMFLDNPNYMFLADFNPPQASPGDFGGDMGAICRWIGPVVSRRLGLKTASDLAV